MDNLNIALLIIIGVVAVDACARFAVSSKSAPLSRSASLVSLFMISITQGPRRYIEKDCVLRQFFLSWFMVVFLLVATILLLTVGTSPDGNVLHYGLLLSPIFVQPFFHLIYDLISVHPLAINKMLVHFRLRGSLALIVSANVIFVAINPIQNIISLMGHTILAFMSAMGSFYLCSRFRKKPSLADAPFVSTDASLETMLLRYLASILEIIYVLNLIYATFIKIPLDNFVAEKFVEINFIALFSLLVLITIYVKVRCHSNASTLLQFYEEKILPTTFLWFGAVSIFRYYF